MVLSRQLLVVNLVSLFIVNTATYECNAKSEPFLEEERILLRDEARDMFYHAYNAYMANAYPADELMPLSCKGRYKGITPSRGDLDDTLGNFSLTLIDSLDTLVVLGDLEEFEHAVRLVIRDVKLNNDIVVSVFETNIRVLGGLLSAHVLVEYLQTQFDFMPWYRNDLLGMAGEIADRILPAFNTTTGIPHARVNLRNGISSYRLSTAQETCTACAGSMILEMATLSRLTGKTIYEKKARKAMDELWKIRNRSSDLMGTILNVHTGEWVRRDAGVGAGIDSYYEYLLKAYILFGDKKYLKRFNRHYNAITNYVTQGAMLLDVYMHRPYTTSRGYMDALTAFWPGLQVLKGDIKPAIQTHELLNQVMEKHKFIPEAFTTPDFHVYWETHPLRPEFIESTYFLYSATGDPYYLEVGKKVLRNIQKYARVPCGYAAFGDVRNKRLEDRMDSFVLSETFKYLFLLFSNKSELVIDLDKFIFTTEGHFLPLNLNTKKRNLELDLHDMEDKMTCSDPVNLSTEKYRTTIKDLYGMCPKRYKKAKLAAKDFDIDNISHQRILKQMGIETSILPNGKTQLNFIPGKAASTQDAAEGVAFMKEIAEIMKQEQLMVPVAVSLKSSTEGLMKLKAGPAKFGRQLKEGYKVSAQLAMVWPANACSEIDEPETLRGKIAVVSRGECTFVDKVRNLENHGAVGAIIVDTTADNLDRPQITSMTSDGTDNVKIPSVFLNFNEGMKFFKAILADVFLKVTLEEFSEES